MARTDTGIGTCSCASRAAIPSAEIPGCDNAILSRSVHSISDSVQHFFAPINVSVSSGEMNVSVF